MEAETSGRPPATISRSSRQSTPSWARKVAEKRRGLPWVPVEKEYEFDTEDGKKSLAELFDGRSQLLAYNIMYGPDYEVGACPGCTNLGDELDAPRVHLDHRDVTLICFSRAPIDRLTAYKQRMGNSHRRIRDLFRSGPLRAASQPGQRSAVEPPTALWSRRRSRRK